MKLDYQTLERTYELVKTRNQEPNTAFMSVGAYMAVLDYFRKKSPLGYDEYDEFTEWVKEIRSEAGKPTG